MTKAALRTLREMVAAENDGFYEDAEIVCDGVECWVGARRIARATVNVLLRLCLVADQSEGNGGVEHYGLNDEGRALAANPDYVPSIAAHLQNIFKHE